MYSSRGNNSYGQQQQQPYASQSAYSQKLEPSYHGSSGGRPEGTSQQSGILRHSSMLGDPQEGDLGGYRGGHAHLSAGPQHYGGGQYSSAYGAADQLISQMGAKGSMPSALEGRRGITAMPDTPKFTSGDYVSSSSHAYGHNIDQLYSDRVSDYTPGDRHQYGDRLSVYVGRELPSEPTARYAESVAFLQKHQPEMYDHMDQPSFLRQEQMLKTQSLPSTSLGGNSRHADFLAARGNTLLHSAQDHHPTQDPFAYSGRMDSDPCSVSMLTGSSYGGKHSSSILGAAPQRNVDDPMFVQGSSNPGYGVSLPPGRDYGTGKGLRGTSLESDYPSGMLVRGAHSVITDNKKERVVYPMELEHRDKEHRRDYSREREKDREREREWERKRQREQRERERERERDREREREREREQERERERQHIFERREKEREREQRHRHEVEVKHERTPARVSRERRGTSLTKDGRPLRQESPRHEALHRRHSPPKEKKRDYFCKVYSSTLVEVERDYLSLHKRYPRLFVSPECSKVVVNWPKGNLKLPLYTPVSFEHDFVEDDGAAEGRDLSSKPSTGDLSKSERGHTVWNSKIILMSGLSQNALEELSSGRRYEDRIPHFCNMLRFSVLRKNNSLMALGGRWEATDGGDPSVDDSSLVRTVLRYAKDVARLDLENCKNWNRFLEIHYDRVGKEGVHSHKEVTVLYVPDLSECLPLLDTWRDQWLAHKKAFLERERLQTLKKQKSGENKAGTKGSHSDEEEHVKDIKGHTLPQKTKASSSREVANVHSKELHGSNNLENVAQRDREKTDKKVKNREGLETVQAGNDLMKEDKQESMQTDGNKASVKKKIVRKIVKQKVAKKKDGVETANKLEDLLDGKGGGEKPPDPEVPGQLGSSSANVSAIKTFKRKKIVKKVVVGKATEKVDSQVIAEGIQGKSLNESESAEDKAKFESDGSNTVAVQGTAAKTAVKKKVIRRVPKKKAVAVDANYDATDAGTKKENVKDEKLVLDDNTKLQVKEDQNSGNNSKLSTDKYIGNFVSCTIETEALNPETQDKKIEKSADKENISRSKTESDEQKIPPNDGHANPKEREHLKDEKERKVRDEKDDSRSKFKKELKDKKRSDEPPRHPGLILQTIGNEDSKLQSLSLSLDSLLDYDEKNTEESTFEISLFAESLYEMLQYEMGSRLLTFLQKLRVRFVNKRNQRKRQRDEGSIKENEKSSGKRPKRDGIMEDVKSNKTETDEKVRPDGKKSTVKESTTLCVTEVMKKHKTDEEEDPEEDPDEVEESPDVVPQHYWANEKNTQVGKMGVDEKSKNDDTVKDEKEIAITPETKPGMFEGSEEKIRHMEINNQGTNGVNKEVLQAFRYFDRNRVGYIRMEDMRLIIHNLGKFLSHRDVKELVQIALVESNTGRDDRILYDKLVKMSDIQID